MEGIVKILETYPKSEEIISFYPHIFVHLQTFIHVDQNCHVLVTRIYNLNFAWQHIRWKENLKYCEQTRNLKKLYRFLSYFVYLGTLIAMLLRGNVHVWLGYTKTRSPGIGTVLHWRPPDVHIFDTDPSLVSTGCHPVDTIIELVWKTDT